MRHPWSRWTATLRSAPGPGPVALASLGALYGASQGLAEVLRHGYLPLGFTRTVYLTLLGTATTWALLGGALGVLWLAVRLGLRGPGLRLRRFVHGHLESPSRRLAMTLLVVAHSTVLVALLALALTRGRGVGPLVIGLALLVSLGLSLWILSLGRGSSPKRGRKGPDGPRPLATFFLWLAFPVVGAGLVNWESVAARAPVNWMGNALLLAASLLLLAVLAAGYSRSRRGRGGREPGRRLAVPLWLRALPGVVVVLAWIAAPWGAQPAFCPDNPKNVLIIGIDTLRADHTSLFRQDPRGLQLTPNLKRLAADAWVYRNATSQAPWTLPAFASILTGRYPQEHGALSLFGSLRRRELLLAEVLREAGYATAAIASGFFVNRWHGFAQGVEHFDDSAALAGYQAITSERVTDLGLEFLARRRPDAPFFLFLHYFDPHHEYRDHPDFSFADDYSGPLADPLDLDQLGVLRHQLTAADIAHLEDRYDEEIAFTDRQVGRVLDALVETGLMDETAVVVVSDHGEGFLRHGWLGHVITLYEELVRVPLILRLPGQMEGGREIEVPVETRAVFATVLDWLGVDPRYVGPGDPLRDSLGSRATREVPSQPGAAVAPVFALVWLPDAPPALGSHVRSGSIRSGDWKLILDMVRDETFLFNLATDPFEDRNLALQHPRRARDLRADLEAWMSRMPAPAGAAPWPQLGARDRRRLRALGYL